MQLSTAINLPNRQVGAGGFGYGASLSLDFTSGNQTLDSRITFTRASTATRVNRSGVIESVAINTPRFTYDPVTNQLSISPQDQGFYEANVTHRRHTIGENDDFLMSLGINFLFIADKNCQLELTQASMHKSNFIDSTRLIHGTFNINKWYRPIEIPFEFKDPAKPIKIKRGDVLAYVKFIPADGKKVVLKQKNFPEETLEAVKACLFVKDLRNRMPLKTLYELSERIRNKLWFNKKKCPFNWRNK